MFEEIIISVVAVGAFSLLAVYFDRWLTERKARESIQRALHDEINLNLEVVQKFYSSDIRRYIFFYTDSYQNARISGELMTLPKELRIRLEGTYHLIYLFNRRVERGENIEDLLDNIKNDLIYLRDKLPQHLKSLQRS